MRYSNHSPCMKQRLLLLVSCYLSILAGCQSTRLPGDHDFDPSFHLEAQSRFSLLPIGSVMGSREIETVLGTNDLPLLAAKSILEEKGFQFVEQGSADFLVGVRAEYHPTKLPEMDSIADKTFQGRSGVNRGTVSTIIVTGESANPNWTPDLDLPGERQPVTRYTQIEHPKEGLHVTKPSYQLWVEVFDAESGYLVWQGFAHSHLAASFAGDEKRLRAVRSILEAFPN